MNNQLKALFLICAMICATSASLGQLLLEETFNTATTDITTLGTWTLLSPGTIGSTGAPPYIVVKTGSALNYPGYFESGVGNAAYLAGGGQDAQIAFTTTNVTGAYYLAFMLKVDSASLDGDYFWMVRNSSNHNRWRGWVRKDTTGGSTTSFVLGVSKGSTPGAGSYSTSKFTFGTTYLLVAKYDFNTASTSDALLSLWVNPAISSFGKNEDPNPVVKNYSETGTSDYTSPGMNRLALIMNDAVKAPYVSIGGIRLASTWATAIPTPPLYYKGSGDITNVANWGTNTDGSGIAPTDFASDNAYYFVKNTSTVNLPGATWTVTGLNSRVIVGSGVTLTVSGGGIISAPAVDVANGGTLTLTEGLYWPTFGNVAGTVSFDNAAGITMDYNYVLPASSGYYVLKSNDLTLGGYALTVKGRIRTNSYKIKGTGTFTLDSAATIVISSPAGIDSNAAVGDIQSTKRVFSRYATYIYAGLSDQVTGNAIPDTVGGLGIQMTTAANVTSLSKRVAVAPGDLSFTKGKFRLGTYELFFTSPNGHSDSSYVLTDGSGSLKRFVSTTTTSTKTMPVGSASEYRRAAITFEGTVTNAVNLSVRYVSGDPGSIGLPTDAVRYYAGGYWVVSGDAVPGITYRMDLYVKGIAFDSTRMRILWRPNSSTAWTYAGLTSSYNNGTLTEPGIPSFGHFAIAEGVGTPAQTGKRYQVEVFASQVIQSDITYGSGPATPSNKTLLLDLYTAAGDQDTKRPLVIFIHGGGFTGGDKVSNFGSLVCTGLARRGYVVASINYRTASTVPNDTVHFEAMMKALQDAKAAVRFFRKNASTYGIDTSQIFATGSSAGSITALHLAYLDSAEVPTFVTWSNINGTFEGSSGNPGFSSRIQGVISNWGAIGDTAWMKPGDVPVYCVHGTSDLTVSYDQIPADGPFKFGSKFIVTAARNKGIVNDSLTFANTGHTLDNNTAKQMTAYIASSSWLYSILKPGTGTDVQKMEAQIPMSVALKQNYPNPFNPSTKILFQLPRQDRVTIEVFTLLGQRVATLVDEIKPAGEFTVTFDASRLASGMYFYQLRAGNVLQTRKMLFLK